jgi:hypothetical protein
VNWQIIAGTLAEQRAGSLLNPQPWFGFHWEQFSGTEAKGIVFSSEVEKFESATITALIFADALNSEKFLSAWVDDDAMGDGAGVTRLTASGTSSEALLHTNKRDRCFLLQIDSLVLISVSEDHLRKWYTDSTARGFWTPEYPHDLDEELLKFEQSQLDDIRVWIKPQKIANRWNNTASPARVAWENAWLPSLLSFSATLNLPREDEPWTIRYQLETTPQLQEAAKLLSLASNSAIELPELDLSDAEAWIVANVEMTDWFGGLSQSMNIAIDPKIPGIFDDMIDAVLTDPEGPRIDLKKDLFYRCKPSITVISKSTHDRHEALLRDYMWVLMLSPGVDANNMAERFFEGDDIVSREQIASYSLWSTLNGESLLIATSSRSGNHIRAMACNSKYLIVSSNREWLKSVLEREASRAAKLTFMNKSWEKRLDPELSEMHSILQGVNCRQVIRQDWEYVCKANNSTWLATIFIELVLGGESQASKIKHLIPDWLTVRDTFGILSHYGLRSPDGLTGTVFIDDD